MHETYFAMLQDISSGGGGTIDRMTLTNSLGRAELSFIEARAGSCPLRHKPGISNILGGE